MATYYVDTGGTDVTNDGSIGEPWATLHYACTQATAVNDIIHINAGAYTEGVNDHAVLYVGVSIEGDSGTPPTITTSYTVTGSNDGYLRLYSASNANGNQSISYINFDGNALTCRRAIYAENRNNVVIHHCNIDDFLVGGIYFESEDAWDAEPSHYITGCSIYSCNITNCSDRAYEYEGSIRATACDGLQCYSNAFTNNARAAGDNGNILTLTFQRNSKFYSNTFTKNDAEAGEWNFFVELFHPRGGVEFYDNVFVGGATLDLGGAPNQGALKGAYAYSLSIHDNSFVTSTGAQVANRNGTEPNGKPLTAIDIETNVEYVYVYNNYIKCYGTGIAMVTSTLHQTYNQNHVYIYNNILDNIGYTTYQYSYGIYVNNEGNPTDHSGTTDNLHIWNNTITGGTGLGYQGIILHLRGTLTNSSIKNNIIYDFDHNAITISRQTDAGDTLYLTNVNVNYNDCYSNGTDTVVRTSITGETSCNFTTGNIITNPDIIASFYLNAGSPCIDTGIGVGLDYDYYGAAYHTPKPSIGAVENAAAATLATVTLGAVTNITETGGDCTGNVTNNGGATVTDRGICWKTSSGPVITDSHVHTGSGTGVFYNTVVSGVAGTLYYVRAFAVNSVGTAYSNEVYFTTSSIPVTPESWATKYRCQFMDDMSLLWTVNFEVNAYTGAMTDLVASGEPLEIESYGADDIMDQHIMGSKMTLNVEAYDDFWLSDLFTADNLAIKTEVFHGATLYWTGFIQANNYYEPYDSPIPGLTISLVATDGLGILKDFPFSDLGYTARQEKAKYVYDILSLVNVTSFKEYVNLYESTMSSAVGDSPLDQCGVDPAVFEGKTCYDALETILITLNAGIRQRQGVIEIFRFVELKDSTMYGRTFTTATAKSATTKTPAQSIDRSGAASFFADVEGGGYSMIPPIKNLNVTQNYGNRESWIHNHTFDKDTFDETDFNYWIRESGVLVYPMGSIVGREDGVTITHATDADKSLSQVFGENAVMSTTDMFTLEFEYGLYSTHAIAISNINAGIRISQGAYGLSPLSGSVPSEQSVWDNSSPAYFFWIIPTTNPGWNGWNTFKTTFTGLPAAGAITIELPTCDNRPYAWLCIQNVRFYASSTQTSAISQARYIPIIKQTRLGWAGEKTALIWEFPKEPKPVIENKFTLTNPCIGKDVNIDFILGDGDSVEYVLDNIIEQFAGALNNNSGLATSSSWATRLHTEALPIVTLIANEILSQYSAPKQLIDLPVRETSQLAFLDINGTLTDTLNSSKKFAIARASFDAKHREWQLTLTELL